MTTTTDHFRRPGRRRHPAERRPVHATETFLTIVTIVGILLLLGLTIASIVEAT